MHKNKTLPLLSLSFCLNFALGPITLKAADSPPRVFRAGAAKSNISPWHGLSINGGFQEIKASFIHDDLHARCLVLDDGSNRLAMVVVDSCMVPREIIEAAKRRVARQIGFNPTNILISATHTHSAPAATPVFGSDSDRRYQEFLALKMGDTIIQAVQNLVPAQIGWRSGTVSNQVFNRRWKMKSGTVLTDPFGGTNDQVKMNPGIGNTNLLAPAGPIDPEVWFISVQSTNGKPIALLANYSLHYCGGVGQGHVSADYFGMFARKMEKLLGAEDQDPAFVAIMSNGTSGDINNVDFREAAPRQPNYGQMRIVADAVAEEVFRKQKGLRHHSWVPLQARQTEINLGVRLPTPEEIATARQVMAQAKGPQMQTPAEVYARETVLMADYRSQVPVVLQALGMGELRLAAIPCEVFVEIGLELKKRFAPAFTVSLANGYNGYLPTAEHHKLGGYETWRARSSYLEVEAADKILKALDPLLSELRSK